MKELIKTNVGLNIKYWIQQWNQEQTDKFYSHQLTSSQTKLQSMNDEIQKGVTESNQKAEKLNETYTKLAWSNKKWEQLKQASSTIYAYQGLLKNALCTNLHNINKDGCKELTIAK
ncbi:hypothetical protein [Candidatus Mycoplasma haematominutum]|uniref:hypothetical protein n=1 Tax=Candidatus Mycoplasma haematominutum TaxID=209446 RepID=UPI000316CAF2|nr:hypothetical protein [Candidatus Mycoplasma haematominutum]